MIRPLICLALFISSLNIGATERTSYTLGVVPQFSPQTISAVWGELSREITRRTGINLRLASSPSIPAFESNFIDGKYDFIYLNPYHLVVANQQQGYMPLLKDSSKQLRGIIVVRKDSHIQNVQELDGKNIAFPAPNALGAALIPRAEFANKFNLTIKENFVKSHTSVYMNVALGLMDAGGGVEKTLAQQPDHIRSQLRVLYKTSPVSPHPIAAHPRVPQDVVKRVVDALLEISKDNDKKSLLEGVPIKTLGLATLQEYMELQRLGLDAFYVRNHK